METEEYLRESSMIRERLAWELSMQPRTARIPHIVLVWQRKQTTMASLRNWLLEFIGWLSITAVDFDYLWWFLTLIFLVTLFCDWERFISSLSQGPLVFFCRLFGLELNNVLALRNHGLNECNNGSIVWLLQIKPEIALSQSATLKGTIKLWFFKINMFCHSVTMY